MNADIGFKTELNVAKSHIGEDDTQYYELKTDLVFFNGNDNIIVRANWNGDTFTTNLASTPRFLHGVLPPDKKLYKRPSVLHDYLYSQRSINRKFADKMFLLAIRAEMRDMLVNLGNPRTKWLRSIRYTFIAYLMYTAVRLFGKPFKVKL